MLTVGFAYFIFLYVDIRMHVKKARNAMKEREKRIQMFEEQLAQTQVRLSSVTLNIQFLPTPNKQ